MLQITFFLSSLVEAPQEQSGGKFIKDEAFVLGKFDFIKMVSLCVCSLITGIGDHLIPDVVDKEDA